jgi:NAD-dependent dihydropyrimidine dehydrogenase PreA subunit
MKDFRYLSGVTTLSFDPEICVGCGTCATVCPHAVFEMNGGTATVVDRDGCMECGACATNCPVSAIRVTPGVGCAAYIIQKWMRGKKISACGPTQCC